MGVFKNDVDGYRHQGLTWPEIAERLGVTLDRLEAWKRDNDYEVISYQSVNELHSRMCYHYDVRSRIT